MEENRSTYFDDFFNGCKFSQNMAESLVIPRIMSNSHHLIFYFKSFLLFTAFLTNSCVYGCKKSSAVKKSLRITFLS